MCKVRTFWAITIQENAISLVLPLLILCLEGRLRPVQTCFLYAFFPEKTFQPFILALNRLCFRDLRLKGLRRKPFRTIHHLLAKLTDFPTNIFSYTLAEKPFSSTTIRKIVFIIRKIIFTIRKIIFPLI